MYATVIVRKKGQVVIPKAVRTVLEIEEGDLLNLNIEKVKRCEIRLRKEKMKQ